MFFFLLENKIMKGNEIKICEIIGIVRLNKVDMEVFVYCQMELKLELEIDKKYVFLMLGFKGYKIGYLYFVIVVLVIVDHIVKKLNVLIICSQKNKLLFYFFGLLFKEKKCFVV